MFHKFLKIKKGGTALWLFRLKGILPEGATTPDMDATRQGDG